MSKDNRDLNKDNASTEHEPKDVSNPTSIPRGSKAYTTQSLGLGSVKKRVFVEVEISSAELDQHPELTPEEKRAAYLKSLPEDTVFVVETGDEAINQECAERGEVVVTENEKAALQAAKETTSKDEISASDFAKAFKRAAARSAELDHDKSKGPDLE